MPLQQALPTWLALNNVNNSSPSGLTDPITGQAYQGGGLNAGDYFDITNSEAANASYTTNGILYAGRYRYVQVDSGATAANVKTGTIGYLRAGGSSGAVKSVVTATAGSGQTAGSYTIAANPGSGGGAGASITVVVAANGTVTANPTVTIGGFGYNSAPTFAMPASAGGVGATFSAQLDTTPNVVTSYDQTTSAPATAIAVRPVVYLNSITPGNYGFIQELGTATVLGAASFTGTAATSGTIQPTTSGLANLPSPNTTVNNTSIGLAVDLPVAAALFKIVLGYAATTVQD